MQENYLNFLPFTFCLYIYCDNYPESKKCLKSDHKTSFASKRPLKDTILCRNFRLYIVWVKLLFQDCPYRDSKSLTAI